MGHGFHQMSPVQEPTALYNAVIHLHQWLKKNEAETCRQPLSFCYEQPFGVLTHQIQHVHQHGPIRNTGDQTHRGKKDKIGLRSLLGQKDAFSLLFTAYVPSALS